MERGLAVAPARGARLAGWCRAGQAPERRDLLWRDGAGVRRLVQVPLLPLRREASFAAADCAARWARSSEVTVLRAARLSSRASAPFCTAALTASGLLPLPVAARYISTRARWPWRSVHGSPGSRPQAGHSTVRSCFIVGSGGGVFCPDALRQGLFGMSRTAFCGASTSTVPFGRVMVTGPAGG
jgi:hypothetical protein